eukprot:6184555-Pleurochrysis_carterae.AAC.2
MSKLECASVPQYALKRGEVRFFCKILAVDKARMRDGLALRRLLPPGGASALRRLRCAMDRLGSTS